MNLTLLIAASLVSFSHGARYGLLRVGSPAEVSASNTPIDALHRESLFDEDMSLLSMLQAQLSLSLAQPLSFAASADMSLAAAMSFATGLSFATVMGPVVSSAYSHSSIDVGGGEDVDAPTTSSLPANNRSYTSPPRGSSENDAGADYANSSKHGVRAGVVVVSSLLGFVATVAVAGVILSKYRNYSLSSSSSSNASADFSNQGHIL